MGQPVFVAVLAFVIFSAMFTSLQCMFGYMRLRSELCMRQILGVKTSFPFLSPFRFYCNVVVLVLVCVSFFPPICVSGYVRNGTFLAACVQIGSLSSFSLCVLIGPGLPLPTDAAPPTTAQCILPATPRDCPRTSLSLYPRSSSLVR